MGIHPNNLSILYGQKLGKFSDQTRQPESQYPTPTFVVPSPDIERKIHETLSNHPGQETEESSAKNMQIDSQGTYLDKSP